MDDEIREYIACLSRNLNVVKPAMPKFDTNAYTDNEYLMAVDDIMRDFDPVDDDHLIIGYLKGE